MYNHEQIELPAETAKVLYGYVRKWDREYLRTPEGKEYLRQVPHDADKCDSIAFIDRIVVTGEFKIDTVSLKIEKFLVETLRHGYLDQYRVIMWSDRKSVHCLTLETDLDKITWLPDHPVIGLLETEDVVTGCFALDRLIAVARGEPYNQYPENWVVE